MQKFEVPLPDGTTAVFDGPEEWTQAKAKRFALREYRKSQGEAVTGTGRKVLESLAQGALWGYGDEVAGVGGALQESRW